MDKKEIATIFRALKFASEKHKTQKRKDKIGTPYINHLIDISSLLIDEANIHDPVIIIAAILHDTLEDTDTSFEEIQNHFGDQVARIVLEVTDDKSLPKKERKRLQVQKTKEKSQEAKIIKIADKICNLRDILHSPPFKWDVKRKKEYFQWAKEVVDTIRGIHPQLESIFDSEYQQIHKIQ